MLSLYELNWDYILQFYFVTVFVGGGGEEGEVGEDEEDEEFCEALSEFEDGEGDQEWGGISSSPLQQSQVQFSWQKFVIGN